MAASTSTTGTEIRIRGARTHNLKNLDLDIPRHQLVVITGPSGSGKSSLAFDTLYAEGQRRYVESLSAYARQFLQRMDRPDVDAIEGLSPAISIEQKAASHNPRSTVGTVTEIHDYLRLLYARAGTPHCPEHRIALQAQSVSEMVDATLALPEATRVMVLAPVARARTGGFAELLADVQAQGFVRFRIDGATVEASDLPALVPDEPHDLDVVVDRIKVAVDATGGLAQRLAESFEAALRMADGRAIACEMDAPREHLFSSRYACRFCRYALAELEPRLFSFNSPQGACSTCDGLGQLAAQTADAPPRVCPDCGGQRLRLEARHVFLQAADAAADQPGEPIHRIGQITLAAGLTYFSQLQLQGSRAAIADKVIHEIRARLQFLNDVGLGYLSLERSADTLSGGEAQRIRLASQIGSGLTGVMYVLDEPSIGLHQRDNERLIGTLRRLRDLGNSVLVVEHDEDTILAADQVIDMGPGAGVHGGQVMAQGTPAEVTANAESLTGRYLARTLRIEVPQRKPWRLGESAVVRIVNARGHNLKGVSVDIPVGLMTCVSGVSGSGKSTLVNDTLQAAASRLLHHARTEPAAHDAIEGLGAFDKVISVDQSPIGRTPRSNPATYVGLFTAIRELFAEMTTARERGWGASRFSFNVSAATGGGRCEACQGDGVIRVEMHFLPDVHVRCDVCGGRRYSRETLDVVYKGKNISDVLALTVEDAFTHFSAVPAIARRLQTLLDVGLGYLQLGQSATTLSGGEAQRVKLALELARRDTGRTLYILDEPTTGLHFADIELLLKVLRQLRDAGNTIVVIEHHLDVIKTCDWLIDMGPEGGAGGGQVVAAGTPEDVAANPASHTGRYLAPLLKPA